MGFMHHVSLFAWHKHTDMSDVSSWDVLFKKRNVLPVLGSSQPQQQSVR